MKKLIIAMLLFCSLQGLAQQEFAGPEDTKVEMADQLRSSGKIYVVVAILSTVLIGMVTYAVILDRRLTKLERKAEK